jgi:hypothetical protein
MNIDEAKAILRIHRPGQTESHDPEVAEALELVRENAELAHWWLQESAFDSDVAAKLARVPPPADLRDRILTGKSASSRISGQPAHWWRSLPAMVAALAILATSAAFWVRQNQHPALADWQTGSLDVLTHVVAGEAKLDVESTNSTELREWLKKAQAPSPVALPDTLAHLKSLGCKTIPIGNERVSIICFHVSRTQLAHLVTVEERGLAKPPPERKPQFVRKGDWVTASWCDQGQAYMLAMKGTEEELRGLLSRAA